MIIGRNVFWCNFQYTFWSISWYFTRNCYVAINPLLYIYSFLHIIQRKWNNCLKGNPYSHVHCIYIHSSLETTNYGNNRYLSAGEETATMQCDYIYIYIWILFCHWKRKKFFPFVANGWNWWA